MSTPQRLADPLAFDLVDRLHKSLRVAGLDATAMAAKLGVHRNTLGKWLRGERSPDRRTLIAWAFATGVPFAWLSDGTVPDGPDGGVTEGSHGPETGGSEHARWTAPVVPLRAYAAA